MSAPAAQPGPARVAGFRTRLLVAMMLIVSAITVAGLYFADRNLTAGAEEALQREFEGQLATLHHAQEVRLAALFERCRALVRKPRIVGALEEAPDVLYLNAEDELGDVMRRDEVAPPAARVLRAEFYRFLDRQGAVIAAPAGRDVGALSPDDVAQLALPGAPSRQQLGYVWRAGAGAVAAIFEVIALPIISTENGEVIAAFVMGFKPFELGGPDTARGLRSGIWLGGRLQLAGAPAPADLVQAVTRTVATPGQVAPPLRIALDGTPHLLFAKQLNPGSAFPPAYEVCIFPLAELAARRRALRWKVLGTGALLLLGGLGASHVLARRLSVPVEKLAVDSEQQRAQLELTHEELQRSARFSADASHQLKTPVTVLRAGLEELLAREHLSAEECHQLSALIHQTYRLSSLIEDLLLLSRMDAGRLKLEFAAVNLTQLIEAALDDLGALPDELALQVETDFPPDLHIAGEKRYTAIILQNLLENARKYNRRGGRIRIAARREGGAVVLAVGNTGRPIPAAAQARIFERFHRGTMGENVPGYGLGLNLARELARLHRGDLRLAVADEHWTEFEVRFQAATAPATPPVVV